MNSQNGVTLTSLAIYIILVLIVLGILATITTNFQMGIKGVNEEGTENLEIDKFNMYFLKEVKKEHGLKKGECGLVLPDEVTVCRSITLPAMTEKQLEVNLPFEFSDYISSDPQKYVYDYALQEMKCDENGKPKSVKIVSSDPTALSRTAKSVTARKSIPPRSVPPFSKKMLK